MKRTRYIPPLVAVLAAIVIEALPFSMTCHWKPEKDVVITETYSYFNMSTVFKNGIYGPYVTAMLCIAVVLYIVVLSIKNEPNYKQHHTLVAFAVLGFLSSLTPLILGSEWYSIYSIIISALLLIAAVMLHKMSAGIQAAEEALKKEREKKEKQRQKAASNAGRKK